MMQIRLQDNDELSLTSYISLVMCTTIIDTGMNKIQSNTKVKADIIVTHLHVRLILGDLEKKKKKDVM